MKRILFLFTELTDGDVEWLLAHGETFSLRSGDVVIREGRPASSLFIVLQGTLAVRREALRDVEIARLTSGEVVGEMSFIDSRPPSATVVAVTEAVLLAVPREAIAAKLASDTAFAARFYRALALILSDRVRAATGTPMRSGADALGEGAGEEEMDPRVLQQVHLAGLRFERLLQRGAP